ncbi:MAG: HAMP domain-containing histidine kinase [Myxococcaceae bacterium]|nr:HAMP domain-containing histidine kinase [Myxococcaceae bacterium]
MSLASARAGFLAVVVLLTGSAAFSLINELNTSGPIKERVERSLEGERLIGLMRLDAELLSEAADDHINATDDEGRKRADDAMAVILTEIHSTSEGALELATARADQDMWKRLVAVSDKLVRTVAVTVKYSNRREAELAKKHLIEEVKPINFELDELANALASQTKDHARVRIAELEALRLRTTVVSAVVVSVAALISLIVMWQVTRLLRSQQRTILDQVNELNRRNEELDAFASRVAHDLVAPLSPLRGYLTLARRSAEKSDVKELLANCESSAARVSDLVEALLRFCRAGSTTDRTAGELDTAVTMILLEVSQVAAAANVALERHLDTRVAVQCPSQLLGSIAQNLLSNAVKYTTGRPDARVMVRVYREKGEAVLEVTDNGRGMSEESQKSLFQPFFRAPEARSLPGHGLGMATTKRLVEAYAGTITVKSQLGVGTQVTVRLPLADKTVDAQQRPTAAPQLTA